MIKFTQSSPLDTRLYEQRIQVRDHIYIDKEKLEKKRKYIEAVTEALEQRLRTIIVVDSKTQLRGLTDDNIYRLLNKYMGCPKEIFTKSNNERGFSVDKSKVLKPLYDLGYAQDFLEAKIKHAHIKAVKSKPAKMMEAMTQVPGEVDHEDRPIHRLRYEVNQQQNLRYNYRNYDIIGIPNEFKNCIVAPKGKVLVWGDFAQADLRVAYNILLRDETNRDVFDSCTDMYEAVGKEIASNNNVPFDMENFKKKRNIAKANTLGPIYGKRSGNTREENEYIVDFSNYLMNNRRYREFYKRIKDNEKLGLPLTITSYFGTETVISVNQRGGKSSLNKALNTPMQTGTSEIVIRTVNKILDTFYSKGFTEDDIQVYCVRHDEPIFLIDEKLMEHSWLFKEFEKVLVDDWSPLLVDFHFGYTYTEDDEALMFKYNSSYQENKHKITILEPSPPQKDFYPIRKVLKLSIGKARIGDKTMLAFVDCENDKVDYLLVDSIDDESIHTEILMTLADASKHMIEDDYGKVVVYNKEHDKSEFLGETLFIFQRNQGSFGSLGEIFAEYMAYRYCTKYGIEKELEPYIKQRWDRLKQAQPLNLIGLEGE